MASTTKVLVVLKIFLGLSIPVTLFLGTLMFTVFDESYYHNQFEQRNVYSNLEGKDPDALLTGVLDYFRGDDAGLDQDVFNEREVLHMADVRQLLNNAKTTLFVVGSLQAASLLSLLIFAKNRFFHLLKAPVVLASALSFGFGLILFFWKRICSVAGHTPGRNH